MADAHGRSSRSIVAAALRALACVKHRGAVAADARSADGSGLLTPIPRRIFDEGTGVAVLFVRGEDPRQAVEAAAEAEGLELVDWREPPVDPSALGELAREIAPRFVHAVFRYRDDHEDGAGEVGSSHDEQVALRLRRRIERAVPEGLYVASCSFRTLVYKSLAPADAIADFYLDLADDRYEAAFTVFHQRFSTNTLPSWERAQPYRTLCHNGEINALWGNEKRMAARAELGTEAAGLGSEELFLPVFDPHDSDSGKLDSAVELLLQGGRDIRHAMAMLMPRAWENARDLPPDLRGFYRYHSALMEPWDGPAGIIFSDGVGVGARLDRNGLRPLRWLVCEDGLVGVCSEVGAIDVDGHGEVRRGRLGPGEMVFVDPTRGFLANEACEERISAAAPYAQWAADGFYRMSPGEPSLEVPDDLRAQQVAHGYSKELLAMVLRPMVSDAYEPTFSMGDDSPLPNLAPADRPISHYLRQRFAQVTNPPIDPLREKTVMSLRTILGPRAPLLSEVPEAARLLTLPSFFLYPEGVDALENTSVATWPVLRLEATFPVADGPEGLQAAVERLRDEACQAAGSGHGTLILDAAGTGPDRVPVPSLLACGAVHQALTAARLRSLTSLVVVADDALDVHSVAGLLGYGADGICPRLALATVAAEADRAEDGSGDAASPEAQQRYQAAVEAGALKILSKMGICTVDSYRGAQIFEVVGLAPEVVDLCFTGSPNVVGGIGWADLGADALSRHRAAFAEGGDLSSPGFFRVRKGGEPHGKDKDTTQALNDLSLVQEDGANGQTREMMIAHLLQSAIRSESSDRYEAFTKMVAERPAIELHDLLELIPAAEPVPLEEVEPASEIVKRFSTGAMSHGALSKEAHETLAQAMNLIGGMSNCGEGGEDPRRFATRGSAHDSNSKAKQVASGRFGVTPQYLAHSDELQIKMAQGSKPGEGGQLPGHKVSREIARLRHTQPGVGLISPPPHHDIYSIEDLAQLIYDLKQVNAAQVSVKLVAEDGVGTIAAGCVKALADVVHISGQNGGTGASPLSSIKHAGLPWELGVVDTQHALVANGLRSRARLRVDGAFMTGRHVVIAALLGADQYSFGTAAMIAEGCIMLRACHRDTCKPGVATQREHLRANFTGTPEGVAAYFLFMAEEVRQHLASLGLRSLNEAIGRPDLLRQRKSDNPRADAMDLSPLLVPASTDPEVPRHFAERVPILDPRSDLGDQLLADAYRQIWDGDEVELSYRITNADRAFGTALSGALALEYGERPPHGLARVGLTGTAGQSFGAFLANGVELHLTGEANDYVGKGMGGGLMVIRPPENDGSDLPILAGNTCLYGATGGELFIAGGVGERFGVRNSGAVAVVESAGDHCCEYMTGGTIVVLGPVGLNLGAGMTGGQAFVFDDHYERLAGNLNPDLVEAVRPDTAALQELRWLVERHAEMTGSSRARKLLDKWDDSIDHLWHILPKDRVRRIEEVAAERVVNT